MSAPDPLILYSTNTWLAYSIAQRYYDEIHYIWCTPFCKHNSAPSYDGTTPPTSSALEIYMNLHEETKRGDRHSPKIAQNKSGILIGADINKNKGIITADQESEIISIVDQSELRDFRPLLFIIPFNRVSDLVKEVAVGERAHPLSVEYKIECLPRELFDVVEIFE